MVYLQDVEPPRLRGRTNKDLAEYSVSLKEALERSNLDKFHLREWYEEAAAPGGD